jgi:Cu-processing system ATP-binding protein
VLRQAFYELVGELAAKGAAVVLSSHVLTELEARTERVAIMRKGKLVVSDSLAALRQRAQLPIRIRLDVRAGAVDGVAAALNGRQVNGQAVELICTQDDKMSVLGRITGLGDAVEDVELAPPSLDDIYRHFGHLDAPGEEEQR